MPSNFSFGLPDEIALQEELDRQHRTSINDYDAFYFGPGITQFRVMPPHPDCKLWFRELLKHRIVVNDQARTKICPTMLKEPCPICERATELYNEATEDSVEAAKKLRPTRRFAVNAVIFSAPPARSELEVGKVYILELPKTVKDELLEMDRDPQAGWADITGAFAASKGDGLMGVSFRVTKSGQGLNTKYSTRPVPARTDLAVELAAVGVDINSLVLYNLDTIFKTTTYSELKELLASAENAAVGGVGKTPVPKPVAQRPIMVKSTFQAPPPPAEPALQE